MFGLEVARPGSGPARTPSAYVATACPPSPSPRCATRPRNRRANRGVSVNPSTDRPTCPYAGVLSSSTMSRSPFGTSLRNCTLSSSSATCWNAAGTIGYVFPLDEYRSSSPQQLLCQFTAHGLFWILPTCRGRARTSASPRSWERGSFPPHLVSITERSRRLALIQVATTARAPIRRSARTKFPLCMFRLSLRYLGQPPSPWSTLGVVR